MNLRKSSFWHGTQSNMASLSLHKVAVAEQVPECSLPKPCPLQMNMQRNSEERCVCVCGGQAYPGLIGSKINSGLESAWNKYRESVEASEILDFSHVKETLTFTNLSSFTWLL